MLNFDGRWRFESPGAMSRPVVNKFSEFIGRMASQGDRWQTLEHFKSYFAGAAGFTSHWSSSESWADSDLDNYMGMASENALMFIEAFYDGCSAFRDQHPHLSIPTIDMMNRVLRDNAEDYQIKPPDLIHGIEVEQIPVPDRPLSLDEQAQQMIQKSLKASEELLAQGHNRPAVSELLWLLETLSTAFKGLDVGTGTVQGKYFNKIAGELRRHRKGQLLDQVLDWVTTLHGYLSSPTGGGIRHGADIKTLADMEPTEATLYSNLIRSYINFLMQEHVRLSRSQP